MHKYIVFDIETDGLKATRMHCFCYQILKEGEWVSGHTTDPYKAVELLNSCEYWVCHNLIGFDLPTLEKLTNTKLDWKKGIDTLGLSWYLYPNEATHGLAGWGDKLGIAKPEIEDWEGLSIEEYIHRCTEDVKINVALFIKFIKKLSKIYHGDKKGMRKLIGYIGFKMYCLKLQSDYPLRLDIPFTNKVLNRMEHLVEEKRLLLSQAMPEVPKYSTKNKPKTLYKKDGSLSVNGRKWFDILKKQGLPKDHEEPVKYISKFSPPNPNSTAQVKDWLYSFGWEPATFNYVREDDGGMRKIPQIKDGKELCNSVVELIDKHPVVSELEGYTTLNSRIAVLKGFIKDAEDGSIVAGAGGFTNTMRLKHRTLVNLPGVTGRNDFSDGRWIRGCLKTWDGRELCGSDLSSLEDSTKQHYMWKYDPEFVKEMQSADYDPHISIGVTAGLISEEEAEFFKQRKNLSEEEFDTLPQREKAEFKRISNVRKKAKITNFSSVYGVGKKKLALTLKCSEKEAETLLKGYWDKNWAVKKVAESIKVIKINDEGNEEMWLFNPVSKLYYSLRYKKDIFSTLNQGTGVFVFDTWIKHILSVRPQLSGQFHDEIILDIKQGNREKCKNLLQKAIEKTNKELSLNVEIKFDVEFGESYADVH